MCHLKLQNEYHTMDSTFVKKYYLNVNHKHWNLKQKIVYIVYSIKA